MIRVGGAALAAAGTAAAAMAQGGATVATSQPAIWTFLGYPFEAAGMIAAIFGCFTARFWIGAGAAIRKEHRWTLDVPVSAMTLATAAAMVIALRPGPLSALLLGAGLGVVGEGIFKVAEAQLRKLMPVFADEPAPAKPDPDHAAAIGEAMRQLHDLPHNP